MPYSGRIARAVVPASTANLGPGFDSLGMALPLFAGIGMRIADRTSVQTYGNHLAGIARDKSNLVYQTAAAVFARAGIAMPELEIAIESDIPLARGLGSSAAAIVGSLAAANALIDSPLSDDELFQMAAAMERHPDNVGAALYGGFVASAWDGRRAEAVRIDPPESLEVLAVIPDFELPTKAARDALPQHVSLPDAVFNVSNSSLLTAALAAGKLEALRHALRDRLHQPHRAKMVPGMTELLRDAPDCGALGAVLSGAGPTMLLLADKRKSRREPMERLVREKMSAAGVDVTMVWMAPCLQGVAVEVDHTDDPLGAPLAAMKRQRLGVSL